jgi:hydroxypyruvate isomerase
MLRLAANLSTLFTEVPLDARFEAAARAGFRGVEIQFPYELPATCVHGKLRASGVHLALFNAPPGDIARGERGLAGLPGREADFRASIARALEYATAGACRRIHVMSGMRVPGIERGTQLAVLRDNIAVAAELAASAAVTLMLEPINPVDVPGYLLDDTTTALEVMSAVAAPNVALQFDFYHQQIIAGDLARRFTALLPRIGHLQLADNPGRHEPGTGEINYPWLLSQVAASPYDGWVGCEYLPSRDTASSLAWARPFLQPE